LGCVKNKKHPSDRKNLQWPQSGYNDSPQDSRNLGFGGRFGCGDKPLRGSRREVKKVAPSSGEKRTSKLYLTVRSGPSIDVEGGEVSMGLTTWLPKIETEKGGEIA